MSLNIELEFNPKISYVMYQNSMDVAIRVTAENDGENLEDVTFSLSSEPSFFREVSCRYESVAPGQFVDIAKHSGFKVDLDVTKIAGMTERQESRVTLTASSGDQVLETATCDVSILPFNYWPGTEMPETASAFITPNASGITKIRSEASDILRSWGESPSLEGYQGSNDRVLRIGAAVYAALEKHNINYVNPPAGFETNGQRVRLPDDVLAYHEGTCIDLAVLYASVLESIGINPMVFFVRGHAFAGFWLVDDHCPESISFDSSAFTRCIRNEEMRAVECTMFTNGSHQDFRTACDSALMRLEDSDSFVCALDVRRSRATVGPLPVRRAENGEWIIERPDEQVFTSRPEGTGRIYEAETESRNLTKDDRWKRDLLDITTRNNLIGMKQGTKITPLLINDISGFEDLIADGRAFGLLPKPQEWDGTSIYDKRPFETELYIGNYAEMYKDDASHGRLRLPLTELETERTLRNIYRAANKELDESGCNCLFIALGVLRWYETPGAKTARYAPLILIPAEIVKKQTGFQIKKLDEETVFNVTMMEKLRQEYEIDIPNMDPLPTEEYGVNVDQILQVVRRNIAGMEGWEVLKGAALGVFSFSQYAMWKDIDSNIDELSRSTVVDCFMNNRIYPAEKDLDEDSDPYDLCLTVPADSSQIVAVKAAGKGKTFIMHGPPGTGKSQTITNIITNELYNGRTVLFVAEKAEALQVVQKRLNQVGIGRHCLELHSNKTEKSKILEQLKRALDRTGTFSEQEQEITYNRLLSIGKQLDSYAHALHVQQPWGLSLYDSISRYESYEQEGTFQLNMPPTVLDGMDAGTPREIETDIRNAYSAYAHVRDGNNAALRSIHLSEVRATTEMEARELLDSAKEKAETLISLRERMASFGLPVDASDLKSIQDYFGKIMSVDVSLADESVPENVLSLTEKYSKTVRNLCIGFSSLDTDGMRSTDLDIKVLRTDAQTSVRLLDDMESAGLADDAVKTRTVLEGIDDACAQYQKIRPDAEAVLRFWNRNVFDIPSGWDMAGEWNAANTAGFFSKHKMKKQFMSKAVPYLRDPTTAFEALASTVNIVRETADSISRIRGIKDQLYAGGSREMQEEAEAIQDRAARLRRNSDLFRELDLTPESFRTALDKVRRAQEVLAELIVATDEWNGSRKAAEDGLRMEPLDGDPEAYLRFRKEIDPVLPEVFNWVNWNHYAARITDRGLDPAIIDRIMDGTDRDKLVDSVYMSVYKTMILVCRQKYESVCLFDAGTFEEMIAEFKSLDRQYTDNNRRLLISKLSRNIPRNLESSVPDSELNILYRAVNGKKIRKSIRKLLSEIPNLLLRICPCLLMSPQSVAQYITMDFPKFDTVIFDESSQITTSKAIGALGRAKSAVIAGDSNQLPPTSFFHKKIESVGDSEDDMVDIDSFLDECLSLNMPETYLEWHYRSRHESLIAFSNRMFYDSKMLTFPSPNDQDARVRMEFVKGVYEKNSSVNKVEAGKVVDEIYRRVMDPSLCRHSIGVIAFSIKQQTCINDILDDRLHDDREFSERFNQLTEKLFIKNLETVQGDERDVILFSIGYGPTKDGVVSQNFGPINRAGGGRRLNVAVSRAREEMIVFSSIKYTDVKLTSTSSSGVQSLKEFLRFAENDGHFNEGDHTVLRTGESSMLLQIQRFLADNGYESRFSIGTSGFKVDVAVVNPECPNEYLIGILADGESYRNSSNTRDREYARADVLRNLGWNITHVWSMEWFANRQISEKKLLDDIETARSNVTSCRTDVPVQEPPADIEKEDWMRPDEDDVFVPETVSDRKKTYVPAPTPMKYEDPDLLLSYPLVVRELAESVIEAETAVNEEYLIRAVSAMINVKRLTGAKREKLTWIIRGLKHEDESGFTTYWDPKTDKDSFRIYRVNGDGSIREAEHIPLPELLNAIEDVVFQCGSVTKEGCVSQVAHEFGYQRVAAKTRSYLDTAVDIALQKGRVMLENERLTSVPGKE